MNVLVPSNHECGWLLTGTDPTRQRHSTPLPRFVTVLSPGRKVSIGIVPGPISPNWTLNSARLRTWRLSLRYWVRHTTTLRSLIYLCRTSLGYVAYAKWYSDVSHICTLLEDRGYTWSCTLEVLYGWYSIHVHFDYKSLSCKNTVSLRKDISSDVGQRADTR